MKLTKVALAVSTLLMSTGALAHGYLIDPPSRDLLCNKRENIDCGPAQYDPQSVGESTKGFPKPGTPPDGHLPSGNRSIGKALDVQSSDRWAKTKIQPGKYEFKWHYTATHMTTDWKYFITKQDWNPNEPLTRDSFELTPFCVIDGNQQVSQNGVTHECVIPERTGYQIIYANWEIGNTSNTFYKTIDVDFGNAIVSKWNQTIGKISPNQTLKAGDSVKTRVFDTNELPELSTTLEIGSDAEGDADTWSKALAEKINQEQKDLRAGSKNANGEVLPHSGLNTIYTHENSGLTRVEIEVNAEDENQNSMSVTGVEKLYTLTDGKAPINLSVTTQGELAVTAKLIHENGSEAGFVSKVIANTTDSLSFSDTKLTAGKYSLVVIGHDRGDDQYLQKTFALEVKESVGNADYEFTYPQDIDKYTAGTKVLQTKTGKVYQCKPFPNSEWCSQYNAADPAYEPGTGRAWNDAWTEVGKAKHQH